MDNKEEKYLQDKGAEITRMLMRKQVQALKRWIGEDYKTHFDETYDRIHERGYFFMPHVSMSRESNGGYMVALELIRQPPKVLFDTKEEEKLCPYGAWFEIKLGVNALERKVYVRRTIIDPRECIGKNNEGLEETSFLRDVSTEVFSAQDFKMLRKVFREKSLDAMNVIRDFSHLGTTLEIDSARLESEHHKWMKSFLEDKW